MTEILYGRNAVRECLRAQRRRIYALHLAKNIKLTQLLHEIIASAQALGLPIKSLPKDTIAQSGPGHQGVALEVGQLPKLAIEDCLALAQARGEMPFLLALDHLQDPQNVGALLRTAEALGVHGVIIPERRSVGITPSVVKASAGATEHIFIVRIANLVQSLKKLKRANLWLVGMEQDEKASLCHQIDLAMPLVIVLGSEGRGLTRLVKEICDFLIAHPMQGQIASLNVSVAGALAMYEAWQARQKFGNLASKFDS